MKDDEKSVVKESINNATINGNAIINNHHCSELCKKELANLIQKIQILDEKIAKILPEKSKLVLLFSLMLNTILSLPDDIFH